MSGNKTGESTKEKILQAAQQEFLEKGYEKTRMEDIATRASLTKTMLYYHFSTKENIFNEIVKKVIDEVRQEFQSVMSSADMNDPRQFSEHLQMMVKFYVQRKSIIRLVLSEQLANKPLEGGNQLAVFRDVFELIIDLAGKKKDMGSEDFLIRVFFFNALPMLLYASMSDQFCSDFGIAPDKCLQVFTETFTRTFISSVQTN